jgi:chromosome segregation ATPase
MTNKERIAELEAQLNKMRTEQADLLRHQTRVEVDLWQGRIDDLELQVHLGAMEAEEILRPAMDKLRATWAQARAQLADAGASASGVADTLRAELASAIAELRKALMEAKHKIS